MLKMHPFRLVVLLLFCAACNSQNSIKPTKGEEATVEDHRHDYKYDPPAVEGQFEPFDTTTEYWRSILTAQEFSILREDGTERSFTSPLNKEKRAGIFTCGGCGLPLFASSTKFNSGTGWPSFYEPIHPNYIKQDVDTRYGMRRVEVSCARCDGHQGHVFPDGPDPTGLRYCINGASLDFVPLEDFPQAKEK
jgi:peptide-methionine (R)-S-oxide reductase